MVIGHPVATDIIRSGQKANFPGGLGWKSKVQQWTVRENATRKGRAAALPLFGAVKLLVNSQPAVSEP